MLVAIPFVPKATDAVQYSMLAMAPDDMDSMEAQEYIDANFNISTNGGSTMIVLKGDGVDSVIGSDVKFAILNMTQAIYDDEDIPDCGVTSLYTPLLDGYSKQVLDGIVEINLLTNGTSMLLFTLPSEYGTLWNLTFASSLMFYGITDMHALAYDVARDEHPSWTVEQADAEAYVATSVVMEVILTVANVSTMESGLAWEWYGEFAGEWNSTSDDPWLVNNSYARQMHAIEAAFPGFEAWAHQYLIDIGEGGLWTYAEAVMDRTITMVDADDFLDPHAMNRVCKVVVDDIIAPYTEDLPSDMAAPIETYLHDFWKRWDDNTTLRVDENLTIGVTPTQSQVHIFVDQLLPALEASLDEDGQAVVENVYAMGWDGYDDPATYNATVVVLVHRELGDVHTDVVHDILELGTHPDESVIVAEADRMMREYDIDDYPLPLPDGVEGMLMNVGVNDTMLIMITYNVTSDGKQVDGMGYVDDIRSVTTSVDLDTVSVLVSGNDAISYDTEESTISDMEKIDPVSILLVLLLIGLFFRSFVSSVIPPAIIGMALGIAMMFVFLIATYVMDVTNYVLVLITVTTLGAGCDYCIFMLSRYREERVRGLERKDALLETVSWAGESITTSGFTVMVGFGVLSICSFTLVSSIGICLVIGIFIALMFALTFLPSLIMLVGDRVFWPTTISWYKERVDDLSKANFVSRAAHRYFHRSARAAIKHAKVILLVAILITVPCVYTFVTMDTSYDMISTMPECESKDGVNYIVDGFGGGKISPIFIAVDFDADVFENGTYVLEYMDVVEGICEDIAATDNIEMVTAPTRPFGEPISYENMSNYNLLTREEYELMMHSQLSHDDMSVMIQVTMEDEPFSERSMDTVVTLRTLMAQEVVSNTDVTAYHLSGGTPLMEDISNIITDEFDYMEMFAIGFIFLILLVVLRSVFTPVRSIVTILMSIIWTLALTYFVFVHGLGADLLFLVPIVVIVVCLGLGMDYDIFLTTRIREEVHKGKSNDEAICDAVQSTGGIITICGLIMAGAFGTMMLSGSMMLKEFGFALSVAILIDATIVRMYLVPAIMSLMGDWNWWAPRFMRRK